MIIWFISRILQAEFLPFDPIWSKGSYYGRLGIFRKNIDHVNNPSHDRILVQVYSVVRYTICNFLKLTFEPEPEVGHLMINKDKNSHFLHFTKKSYD